MRVGVALRQQVHARIIIRAASHLPLGSPYLRGSLCITARPLCLRSTPSKHLGFTVAALPTNNREGIINNVVRCRRLASAAPQEPNNRDGPKASDGGDDSSAKPEEAQERDFFSPHRHAGLRLHPDSIGIRIMPGNMVYKANTRRGARQKRYTELVYGYFWMIKDLRMSAEKPILSNLALIPDDLAKPFPSLDGLRRLDTGDKVNVPSYFVRRNRSRDAAAQCTVVCVYFRDFGYQALKSWVDPFQQRLQGRGWDGPDGVRPSAPSSLADRVEVVRLNISEGWLSRWVLQGLILGLTRRNTPPGEAAETLTYFGSGSEMETFRDALRMHNVMSGYVFLVDGMGRVRFAGSGPATDEDVDLLWQFATELTQPPQRQPSRRGGNAWWVPQSDRPKRKTQ